MAGNQYKIELGIKLNTSDLKTEINKLNDKHKINVGVNLNVNDIRDRIIKYNQNNNNAKLNLGIKLDTSSLKSEIAKLNLNSNKSGKGIAIPVDTKSLEVSFKEIQGIITDIKNSLGTLDSKTNTKSLVASINQIADSLEKATNESNGLVSSLKTLANKDFSVNFGVKLGGTGNSISNNTAYGNYVRGTVIPQLQNQADSLMKAIRKEYSLEFLSWQDDSFILNTLSKRKSYNAIKSPEFLRREMADDKNLSKQMSAYIDYINLIEEVAKLSGVNISNVTSGFSATKDELIQNALDIQSGVKIATEGTEESFEKLKSVFNTGVDSEGLSNVLDPIIKDLKAIREFIDGLSKSISINDLTQSFNKLSDTLEEVTRNAKLIKDIFESISSNVNNNITKAAGQIGQQTKKLISDSAQKSIDDVTSKKINEHFIVDEDDSESFKTEMENLVSQWTKGKGNLVDVQIETRTSWDSNEEKNVERLHQAHVTYQNAVGESIKKTIAWRQIGTTTNDETGLTEAVMGFVEVSGRYSKSISETKAQTNSFVKQQKQAVSNLTNQINQLNRAATDQNAPRSIKEGSHLNTLSSQYNDIIAAIQRMGNASSDTFIDAQNDVKRLISEYKSLVSELRNAENVATSLRSKDIDTVKNTYNSKLDVLISKMRKEGVYTSGFESGAENLRSILSNSTDASGLVKFLNGLDKLEAGYKRASSAKKEFNQSQKVGINVSGLESKIVDLQRISPEIDRFETEINGAKVSVQSLLEDLQRVNTQGDFSVVNSKWKAFSDAAKAAGIAVTETTKKAKTVNEIKIKLEDTGFDGFEQEVNRVYAEVEKLEGSSKGLEAALKQLDIAMNSVYSAEQSGNAQKLIDANNKYENALKQVYSQLKLLQQEEKKAYNVEILNQKKATLSSEMEIWLKENTRATKDFGEEVRRLQASLNNLDDSGVKLVGKEFTSIKKQAQAMGKTGLSVFDKLKAKAKEYAAYLSAAEIFMYAEQAFRSIFEAVKEIDTAMTGLYRVTNLTSAEYDALFDNMIASAKKYGATLNDIINATSDWVRAGFKADTALGLAEVTTMYQHISDLDYDTAAENLITAYNGFKDELNTAFGGDEVAAVEYIADILNELDNQFAVTSAGLGDALSRSASALDLAGNSIQETAGMVTGIVEVTQDPEKAGSALKILSLRLRGMKGQLEELGEETDENVENISKMQGQILNMTSGKVNIFDASGDFKSTYEIMKGIAEVWDDLSSVDQANLLETIAGKNRANDVAALLSNWENVEAAVKSASEAEGSASIENAKYVDSIQGRLDKLTTSWQSFANTFMNSDFLKGSISFVTTLLNGLEKVVKTFGTLPPIITAVATGMSAFKNFGFFSVFNKDVTNAQKQLALFGKSFTNIFRDFKNGQNPFVSLFKKSITKADVGYITEYFNQIKSGIPVGQAYANTLSHASVAGKKMAVSIKKGTVELGSLKSATTSGKIALFGLEAAATAANVALTMGLSIGLQALMEYIVGIINRNKDLAKSVDELTSKFEEQHSELKKFKNNYDISNENSLISKYAKLSKGVDNLGRNVSLTSDEYSDYQNTVNTIAEQIPSLVSRYDEQGNAILNVKGNVSQLVEEYEKLVKAQNDAILNNAGDIVKDFENSANSRSYSDRAWYKVFSKDLTFDDIEFFEKALEDGNVTYEELERIIAESGKGYARVKNAIESAGLDWSKGVAYSISDIQRIVDGFYNEFESELDGIKKIPQAILSNAFDISSSDYYGMNDTLKSIVEQFVDGLDDEFYLKYKGNPSGLQDYINNILEQFNSIKNSDVDTIETAFNLKTQFNGGDISYGEYARGIQEAKNMIDGLDLEEEVEKTIKLNLNDSEIQTQYNHIYKYLLDKSVLNVDTNLLNTEEITDYYNTKQKEIREFLNTLTADEFSAAIDIKAEIDWENASAENIRKQIEEKAKLNKAMSFTIDIKTETENIEAFNTALAESKSATGLTAESIGLLKNKYEDLDGYDAAKLFEETASGIRINTTEVSKLEKEYKNLNKQEIDNTLKTLKDEYDKLTDKIASCTDDQENLNDLYSDRDAILEQINNVAALASQYDGLTSSYNEWLRAQEAGQDRDQYESILSGREDIEDEMSRGWLDDAAVEYLELLSGKDLTTEPIENQIAAYKELDKNIGKSGYSIWDFFTEDKDGNSTSDGVFNFFDTVKTVAGETAAWVDENGSYHFNFEGFEHNGKTGDAAIAEILGTSEELVQILLKAAEDAGFVVNIEGEYTDLADATDSIEDLNNQLKNVGATNYTFNVKATDLDYVNEQISEAQLALQYFENRDGKINLDDTDVRAASSILGTLIYRKSDLENPILMSINVEEPTTKLEEVLNIAQKIKDANANLEIQTAIGADTTEAQAEIDSLLSELSSDNYADITAGLNIDASSIDTAIASINAISGEQMVSLGLDATKIDGYIPPEKEATVKYDVDSKEVDEYNPKDLTRKVIFNVDSYKVDIYNPSNITRTVTYEVKESKVSEVNGTANVNGTAFSKGSWGINNSGSALGGELGTELLVRNGRWYTIGEHGAEFFNYRKDDIIFNHRQTEELFKNGKVTSGGGRGKTFANGSAFVGGKAFNGSNVTGNPNNSIKNAVKEGVKEALEEHSSGSNGVNNLSDSRNAIKDAVSDGAKSKAEKSKAEKEKTKEIFDWIEVKIDRLERVIDQLDTKANSVYRSWGERNEALVGQIGKVTEEIELQKIAAQRYLQEANSVGLDESWAEKARKGLIDISTIEDEDLANKISKYQEWYDKMLDCEDKILELTETESELIQQKFDNVLNRYDSYLSVIEHEKNMLEEYINQSEAQGWLVSTKYYDALYDNELSNIEKLEEERANLLAQLGEYEDSEQWYENAVKIDEVTLAIEEANTALLEYKQTIQELEFEQFDLLQEKISAVSEEADFLVELMSNKKLFDKKGRFTDEGMASVGLHGVNYNTYMYQAEEYAAEARRIKELMESSESDALDKDLEARYREMISLQQESILAAEGEKDAIKDLVAEGIEIHLDALQELIDKKKEALQSEKDLYDYQKKVKEQTKEIASLEKQMAAYQNDTSEEAKAKIQELKVSLEDAKADLEETEYEKFISDTEALLDELYLEYETILNERLDDIDALMGEMIEEINTNASTISETISESAENVNYKLSEEMDTIWDASDKNASDINDGQDAIKEVVAMFGENFKDTATTTNTTLDAIKLNTADMIRKLDSIAEEKASSAKDSSVGSINNISENPIKPTTPTSKEEPKQTSSSGDRVPKVGDKVIFLNGKYYHDSFGTNPAGSKYHGKEVYITNINNSKKATHPYHISTGKKLGSGNLGWLKLDQISGYATGKRNFLNDEIAWTQENREREFIVRPSDGAILTPIAKGDSVLNSTASNNIWNMANSPAEFIRDSLNIGTSVPNNSSSQNNYTQHFENVVFSMPNVQNYDEMLKEMQKDKNFERLIDSMTIGRLAGKSSLAKGKSIR